MELAAARVSTLKDAMKTICNEPLPESKEENTLLGITNRNGLSIVFIPYSQTPKNSIVTNPKEDQTTNHVGKCMTLIAQSPTMDPSVACYIFKRRAEGARIIEPQKNWEKLIYAAHLIVNYGVLPVEQARRFIGHTKDIQSHAFDLPESQNPSKKELLINKKLALMLAVNKNKSNYQLRKEKIYSKNSKRTAGKKYAAHNFH